MDFNYVGLLSSTLASGLTFPFLRASLSLYRPDIPDIWHVSYSLNSLGTCQVAPKTRHSTRQNPNQNPTFRFLHLKLHSTVDD